MTARRASPQYITRAIAAVRDAGVVPGPIEITADGSVIIHPPRGYDPGDAFDGWKRGRKSKGRASGSEASS